MLTNIIRTRWIILTKNNLYIYIYKKNKMNFEQKLCIKIINKY